ncbi:MAG: DUF2256 domain-containing protein [Synechococcaceae cyanobacterium SM1_2_3]|nr:DUF2256 domain-containing protein [Synechococcaceae cyanobacterium SM1_2_3]
MKKVCLPEKNGPICARLFVWRKKWATCWHEAKACSARCRGHRSGVNGLRGR